MNVRVRLIGRFIPCVGFDEKDLQLPVGCTAAELTARLKIEEQDKIITRNGLPLQSPDQLVDGDRVVIAPIFSGG